MIEKAPKQSQFARTLIIGRSQFMANPGEIGQANEANFGGSGGDEWRMASRSGRAGFRPFFLRAVGQAPGGGLSTESSQATRPGSSSVTTLQTISRSTSK